MHNRALLCQTMRLYASLLRHTPYDIESRAGARARKGITTNPTMLANPPPTSVCLVGQRGSVSATRRLLD